MVQEDKEKQTTGAAPAAEEEVPASDHDRIIALEEVVLELVDRVEKVATDMDKKLKDAGVKAKGLFGGKRTPTPTKDLKTGIVYPSKASVGKQFASEAGADPLDSMAYYKVIAALKMDDDKDRFVDASEEEGVKARADQQAKIDAEVAERNKELEAEAAAAAKTETPPAEKPKK